MDEVNGDSYLKFPSIYDRGHQGTAASVLMAFKSAGCFVVRREIVPTSKNYSALMDVVYTLDEPHYFVGDPEIAKVLIHHGIREQIQPISSDRNRSCTIGFNPTSASWFGWTHRAFGMYSKELVLSDDWFGRKFEPDLVGRPLANLDECKRAAIAHVRGVS